MENRGAFPLSRRQLIAATVSGALLGSAWATAFRETTSHEDVPAVTIARNRSSLAALIEHERKRLLLLDSPSATSVRALTELVSGFTRQRIDVLLATSDTIANFPDGFVHRWVISEVLALPDTSLYPAMSLGRREVMVAEMRITADRVVSREWRRDTEFSKLPWYLTARYRASRIVIASESSVLRHLPPEPESVTCFVCNDLATSVPPGAIPADAIAVPSDSDLFDHGDEGQAGTIVPLHLEIPTTFRMTGTGIELPAAF